MGVDNYLTDNMISIFTEARLKEVNRYWREGKARRGFCLFDDGEMEGDGVNYCE